MGWPSSADPRAGDEGRGAPIAEDGNRWDVLGDLTGDGVVGMADVALLLSQFGRRAEPLPYFCNHQVVAIKGTIYDPSYGRTYVSVDHFDDAAVEAHGAFLGTADGCDYELFFTSRGASVHLEAVVTDWPVVPESQCFMSY